MSANETYELAVQLRDEGAEETKSDIQGVGDEFEQTADTVEDTAGEMEGFSERWRGAMTAIVGGLAVASAGLLSQVPILGELMGGLAEIISAVAFQMDQVLRPALEPLTGLAFDIANGIYELDGAAGDAVGILGSLILVAAGLATALAGLSAVGIGPGVAGGFAILAAGAKAAVIAIAGVISSLSAAALAIAAVIAAIAVLAVAFITDFKGIRTATVNILSDVLNTLIDWGQSVVAFFIGLGAKARQFGADLIGQIIGGIESSLPDVMVALNRLGGVVAGALAFDVTGEGVDLISGFVNGMQITIPSVRGVLSQFLQDISGFFTSLSTNAAQWGADLIQEFISGVQNAIPNADDVLSGFIDQVTGIIGFDVAENDRMARRWGADLIQEFAVGFDSQASAMMPEINGLDSMSLPTPEITPDINALDSTSLPASDMNTLNNISVPGPERESADDDGPSRPASGGGKTTVVLDGRRVDKGVRPHRADETAPRGRHS